MAFVTFFRWELVRRRLEESFQDMNNGLFPFEDDGEHGLDDNFSGRVDEDYTEAKTEAAIGIFMAIFRNHPDFKDRNAITDFLSMSTQPPSRHDVREDLIGQAHDMYRKVRTDNRAICACTPDELWSRISRFTHGRPADDRTNDNDPWPFVELVS
jgi:hypothetical protein